MSSSDGLDDTEIIKLLFKNYMNSITTSHSKEFYEENIFANNTNIFSSGILIDSPPVYSTTPSLINVSNDVSLSEYLSYSAVPNINIDSTWFDEKTISTTGNVNIGSFSVNETNDSERTILRFEQIKLDYLGSGSSSFSCIDNSGTNILQNIIPSNYSTSGYSIELYYDKNRDGNLTLIGWLTDSGTIGEDFGAALYDTKNGIITFYDDSANSSSERETLFKDKDFYFTATKYIGINNINVLRSLETLGDVSINSSLDISNNAFIHNELQVDNDVSFGRNLFVSGDASFGSTVEISGLMVTEKNFIFETNTTEKMIIDTSNITLLNNDPSYSALDISATSALRIPVGTQDQRPTIQNTGQIRYNTSTKQFEGYGDTGKWQGLGGIIDVDQDTFILAETQPDADNDQIQIFTASFERMKVDASGNIQMMNSDSTYSALDISATSALQIPVGTQDQRPTNSENPGALRFNRDTSLCEVYTESNIWSGLPVYKTEQPPAFLDISFSPSNQTVTVTWEKFNDIYKDAYDGKCYPIFLQTFVDISFTDINGTGKNTDGWKTIRIGNGNYDESDNSTTFLQSIVFDSINGTNYNNSTGYTIDFTDKPQDTIDLPAFTQNDLFDIRVYAVNKSGTIPNYIDISNVQLKQTAAPSEVDVINFDTFSKTSFQIDVSFEIDDDDPTITDTSVLAIEEYDISYALVDSKSIETRTDSGSLNLTSTSTLSKSNISVSGLFPGAKYDIQVKAKNASNSSFGLYGDVSTSSGFTNNSNDTTGTNTTQYIEYSSSGSDLNSVTPNNMTFTLKNTKSIYGYTSNGTSLNNKTITNENGYITLNNTSEFYVNYTKQGIDMSGVDNLVQATVQLLVGGYVESTDTITYDGTNNPSGVSVQTIDISNGGSQFYQFRSGGAYTDKAKNSSGDDSTIGFVYSSTFDNSNNTTEASLNEIFVQNFPPSIDIYELKYTISGTDLNGSTDNYTKTTNSFYVDNYESTPVISWNTDPYLTVDSSSSLFGIPSVLTIRLQASFDVSGFASYIIPHSNNSYIHSYVSAMTDTGYSFSQQTQTNINSTNTYTFNGDSEYNETSNITSDTYNTSPSIDFSANVYYLGGNSGSDGPTLETYSESKNVTMDNIFRDSVTTYSGSYDLYLFDSVNSVLGSQITNFTDTPSDISTTLLYFNDNFVSGGYTNSNGVLPFSNWSTGYAVNGPDYSIYDDTGSIGSYGGSTLFKWIVLEIDDLLASNGDTVDLSGFEINGATPLVSEFGSVYEAYIGLSINTGSGNQLVFGSLHAAYGAGNTKWYNNDINSISTISDSILVEGAIAPSSSGYSAQVGTVSNGTYSYNGIYLIVGLNSTSTSTFNLN